MLKLNYTGAVQVADHDQPQTVDARASPPGNVVRAIASYRTRMRLSAVC